MHIAVVPFAETIKSLEFILSWSIDQNAFWDHAIQIDFAAEYKNVSRPHHVSQSFHEWWCIGTRVTGSFMAKKKEYWSATCVMRLGSEIMSITRKYIRLIGAENQEFGQDSNLHWTRYTNNNSIGALKGKKQTICAICKSSYESVATKILVAFACKCNDVIYTSAGTSQKNIGKIWEKHYLQESLS